MSSAPPTVVRGHLPGDAQLHAMPGSEQADVWRADFDGGPRWIKVHRHAPQAAREAAALKVAASTVGAVTPTLLAFVEPSTLVLSHVDGTPWTSSSSVPTHAWRALGAWVHTWFDQPVPDDDPLDPAAAYATRFERALSATASTLAPRLREAVQRCIDPSVLTGRPRGWCHRDLSLDNLRWSSHAGLGVLDFGQARADVWPSDLAKLWSDPRVDATARRELVGALPGGLDARDEACLRQAILLHGLVTLGWGVRHGVAARVDEGRRIVAEAVSTSP